MCKRIVEKGCRNRWNDVVQYGNYSKKYSGTLFLSGVELAGVSFAFSPKVVNVSGHRRERGPENSMSKLSRGHVRAHGFAAAVELFRVSQIDYRAPCVC